MGAKMSNFFVHLYLKVQVLVNKPIVLLPQLDLGFVQMPCPLSIAIRCTVHLQPFLTSKFIFPGLSSIAVDVTP
jgi:hypothetical protein